MKITLEASDGKTKSFFPSLTRDEEKELFKSFDENQDKIAAYNLVAAVIGIFRNWK